MAPLRRLVLAATLALGCNDTTGVYLTVRGGGISADELRVTARATSGSATHDFAPVGGSTLIAWPITLEAVLPATVGSVTFSGTALRNGTIVATGSSPTIAVPAHRIVDSEIDLVSGSDGGGDFGGAFDLGGDGSLGLDDAGTVAGAYTRTLSMPRGKVSAQDGQSIIANYPLLVSLADPTLRASSAGGHVARSDGGDIRFTALGGTCGGGASCILDHELMHYDPNGGVLIAWVRVPSLNTAAAPSDTIITLAYGEAAPPGSPSAAGVWDGSFVSVWHLDGNANDSTSHARNGTASGTSNATGQIGGALAFDGIAAHVDVADTAALDFGPDADFTISLWAQSSQGSSADSPRLVSKRDDSMPSQGYDLVLHSAGAADSWSGVLATSGALSTEHGRSNVADGNWHLITLVRHGAQLVAYEDGAAASPTAITSGDLSNAVGLRLGAEAGATAQQFFAGNEDEVRISNVARSPDWILTDFASQSAPGSFIVVGNEIAP